MTYSTSTGKINSAYNKPTTSLVELNESVHH